MDTKGGTGAGASGARLPERLEKRRQEVEARLGRRVVVREVRTPDAGFRGRIRRRGKSLWLEYQISQVGYFWQAEVIEDLLELAAEGAEEVTLRAETT